MICGLFVLQTNNNPSDKNITSLERYLIVCLGFVFTAMLEFAVVLFVTFQLGMYRKQFDNIAFIIFGVIFILFNLGYWM